MDEDDIMRVVYTAVFNRYDNVRSPSAIDMPWTYTCICNPWMSVPAPWGISIRDMVDDNPRLSARYYKILSHEAFPNAGITVWHGGNVQLQCKARDLAALLGDNDIAVLRHSERVSVYDEAKVCIGWRLDDRNTIESQMLRYQRDEFSGEPLSAAFLMVRRHTDRIKELNEMWWDEVSNGSVRDQLSFDYCCWRLGITPSIIPGDIFSGPCFKRYPVHRGG